MVGADVICIRVGAGVVVTEVCDAVQGMEELDRTSIVAVREARITLSLKKCHFAYTSILLLGQKVSQLGLSMHNEKVRAITKLAAPMNLCSLQSFLGMAIYFLHYIPGYVSLATPLFELLRKNMKWNWGRIQEEASKGCNNPLPWPQY